MITETKDEFMMDVVSMYVGCEKWEISLRGTCSVVGKAGSKQQQRAKPNSRDKGSYLAGYAHPSCHNLQTRYGQKSTSFSTIIRSGIFLDPHGICDLSDKR